MRKILPIALSAFVLSGFAAHATDTMSKEPMHKDSMMKKDSMIKKDSMSKHDSMMKNDAMKKDKMEK